MSIENYNVAEHINSSVMPGFKVQLLPRMEGFKFFHTR